MEQVTSSTEYGTTLPTPPHSTHANDEARQTLSTSNAQDELQKCVKDRYTILNKLGKGGQGHVYLAENVHTHERVAIKQLLIQSVTDWKQYDLFQREAQTLQRISIDGVAKLHETLEFLNHETPMTLIVQDYIEAESMQGYLNNGHSFRIDQIGDILSQLLTILKSLHQSRPPVIHRDLKPSNILLKADPQTDTYKVYLIDFGAVANPQLKGGGSTVVGTYGYMAPEQLMGYAVPQSDLYSLAIVTVYLLSGTAPENIEIRDLHLLIDPHLEHLPNVITAFLRQMLEQRVEERMTDYGVIQGFFTALRNQRFDAIQLPANSISLQNNKRYQLEKVKQYNQAGNIELWQSLPNQTPRSIPKSVYRFFAKRMIPFLIRSMIFSMFAILGIFCIIYIASLYDLSLDTVNTYGLSDKATLSITLFIIVPIALIPIILLIRTYRQKEFSTFDFFHTLKNIRFSRKSIATIQNIKYVPCSLSHNYYSLPINITLPTWRITYSFNPPESDHPIVHSVETHCAVNNLKEGDLIPILYNIQNKKKNTCIVSTPYPKPIIHEKIKEAFEKYRNTNAEALNIPVLDDLYVFSNTEETQKAPQITSVSSVSSANVASVPTAISKDNATQSSAKPVANSSTSTPNAPEMQQNIAEAQASKLETPEIVAQHGYKYVSILGEGSNGKTYRAVKLSTGEVVAIKALKFNDDLKSYDLFQREAEILKSIHSPWVPKYYETIASEACFTECWLVQEFIDGRSLQDILDEKLKNRNWFTEQEVREIIEECGQIIKMLQNDFTPSIIHRDIKPSNIMYLNHPRIYKHLCLIDFGAVANPAKRSNHSTVAGTVGYMPPEQLIGECTLQSDYFALGATALHLLTGIAPSNFPSDGFTIRFEQILKTRVPNISQDTIDMIKRLLAPDPADRPQNATQLCILVSDKDSATKRKYRTLKLAFNSLKLFDLNSRVSVLFYLLIFYPTIMCLAYIILLFIPSIRLGIAICIACIMFCILVILMSKATVKWKAKIYTNLREYGELLSETDDSLAAMNLHDNTEQVIPATVMHIDNDLVQYTFGDNQCTLLGLSRYTSHTKSLHVGDQITIKTKGHHTEIVNS